MISQRWQKNAKEAKKKILTCVGRGQETKLQIVNPPILSGQKINIKFSAHFHFHISHIFCIIQEAATEPNV